MSRDKHDDEYGVDNEIDNEIDTEEEFDELDFDDDEYEGGMLRWLSVLFVLAAVGGFVALAWYAYKSGVEPVSEDEIPMVAADTEPYKETPEDPGGLQFDHQDKSVYNQLASGEGAERPMAERLLPPPEEPVEREVPTEAVADGFTKEPVETITGAPAEPPAASAPETAEEKPAQQPEIKPEPAVMAAEKPVEKSADKPADKPAEKVTMVPSTKSEEDTMAVIEKEQPKAAPAAKPEPVVSKTTAKPGQYMAQLGAFSSQGDAEAAWKKVNAAHGSAFPTKGHVLQQAVVNGKTYHRLQVGPFDSETSARKVCSYLQQNKQACFVVSVK
jgi:cell division septation protein DedD